MLKMMFFFMILLLGACEHSHTPRGTPIGQPFPNNAKEASKVVELVGGFAHVCALLENHRVKCWGDKIIEDYSDPRNARNVRGQRYDVSNARFSKISAFNFVKCGILEDAPLQGIPVCFGPEGEWLDVPHERVKDIAVGKNFVCFIKEDDKLACVGSTLHFLTQDGTSVDTKASNLVFYGVDAFGEKLDYSQKTFKNIKATGDRVCGQGFDDVVYCMGQNIRGEGAPIADPVLDYYIEYTASFFILKNGDLAGDAYRFRARDKIQKPGELKYKKFAGPNLLTAAGNKYDDGSNMPENTMLARIIKMEESVLGGVDVQISHEAYSPFIVCMIKGNHKVKCEPTSFKTGQKTDCPLVKNIPEEIAY